MAIIYIMDMSPKCQRIFNDYIFLMQNQDFPELESQLNINSIDVYEPEPDEDE